MYTYNVVWCIPTTVHVVNSGLTMCMHKRILFSPGWLRGNLYIILTMHVCQQK